jgi:NTE family protein
MVALLTEQNVSASLATLKPGDIYIKPEMGDITAGSFDRNADAAERGRVAAEAMAEALSGLSVTPAQYAAWRRRIAVRERAIPRIDGVEIAGLSRVNPAVVMRYLEQQDGAPMDTATLNRDLLRAYGDGSYERVDYTVLSQQGKNILRVTPVEKSWGPDYLRLALQLDSNLSQGSTYRLRAGYQKTWLNSLGGELLLIGELGNVSGVGAEFYQPVDPAQRWFVDAQADHKRERSDYWRLDQRIAEYVVARSRLDLTAGMNFNLLGQLRLGWREMHAGKSLDTGVDIFQNVAAQSSGGWLLSLDMDQLDRLYFPRRGWAAQAVHYSSDRSGYSRVSLDGRAAWPLADWVLGARASWTGSPRGNLPLYDAAKLGGFLNLTGYASGQLIGDESAYAHVRTERIIGRAQLGLRGDLRLGLALEVGKIAQPYTQQVRNGWLNSVALYLGGETVFGPVFVGVGRASSGSVNAYLVVGAP